MTREVLIKTLTGENGALYCTVKGRQTLLAHCTPEIEVFERQTKIPILGKPGGVIKKVHFTIVLCDNTETTRDVTPAYLSQVERFALETEIQRKEGVFERITFMNMDLVEIDCDGRWVFEPRENPAQTKHLLDM